MGEPQPGPAVAAWFAGGGAPAPASGYGGSPGGEPKRTWWRRGRPAHRGRPEGHGSILDEILAQVRGDLAARQARTPLAEVKQRALARPSAMDGARALRGDGVAVVAEAHRYPSPGEPGGGADPAALAGDCERGGASVISVLTAARRFGGSLGDLARVRERVEVPVLCKDFVLSSYQLWEARAHGADLVLLIVAALEQDALVSLVERAESIGMTPLIEVHDEEEVTRAVAAGARAIAVSARDPLTLHADRGTFARLAPLIPEGIARVAECGARGPLDLIVGAKAGADAVMVGGPLVAGRSAREVVAGMVAAGTHPALWRGRDRAA